MENIKGEKNILVEKLLSLEGGLDEEAAPSDETSIKRKRGWSPRIWRSQNDTFSYQVHGNFQVLLPPSFFFLFDSSRCMGFLT